MAEVFEILCTRVGIKHKMGSPEHPENQAHEEKQNQLVNQMRCLCENNAEKSMARSNVYKIHCLSKCYISVHSR